MNLPANRANSYRTTAERFAYAAGHRDARHAAAELALASSSIKEDGERAETKPSAIHHCYFHTRDSEQDPLFSDGGSVCVQLHRYALIPLEVFHDPKQLAQAVANAKESSSPPSPLGDTPNQQEQKR